MTKHSQFAQLVDPTRQAVSHQSIVIDNIRKSAGDMLLIWKQTMIQIGILNKSMATHISKHEVKGLFKQNESAECHEIVTDYNQQMKNLIQKIEIPCAHVEGLPAAVKGDYGIYTKETQPAALSNRSGGVRYVSLVYKEAKVDRLYSR